MSFGATLLANTTSNNGGAAGWGMFFDVTAVSTTLNITSMTTFSSAPVGGSFSIEVFRRSTSALGGALTGAGSSSSGWTSLGIASATQGAVVNGESLAIDIPGITVVGGTTVGVALVFINAGPNYFGTGSAPLQDFTDGVLSLKTGDARSAPFTQTGTFFSSRGLSGSLTYEAVPEPMTLLGLAAISGYLAQKRKKV
ncbi:hypothetical protein C0431_09940 [bacterium]|nr:hypothetical protein [bacterium]